jgi:hypothetical protein
MMQPSPFASSVSLFPDFRAVVPSPLPSPVNSVVEQKRLLMEREVEIRSVPFPDQTQITVYKPAFAPVSWRATARFPGSGSFPPSMSGPAHAPSPASIRYHVQRSLAVARLQAEE